MYFGDLPQEAKVKRVQELVSRLTQSEVNEETAAGILGSFESFESFVESGRSFTDLQQEGVEAAPDLSADIMEVVGSFGDFLSNRGGALATNEVWMLMAFLYWTKHCMALTGKEAKLVRSFKKMVQGKTRGSVFRMDTECTESLQSIIKYWVQEVT